MSQDFEFNFPAVKVSYIKLEYLRVPINKLFKNYYYLSARLDNQNGSAQFLYKGMYYTFENLYIVGNIVDQDTSDTKYLIISYKTINDYNNKTPVATLFVLFPLTITTDINDTNVISGLIEAGKKKTSLVNSVFLNSLLENSTSTNKGLYKFSHYNRVLNSGITNMNILRYEKTINVYVNSSTTPKITKWLDVGTQKTYSKPISLTTLRDTLKNKKNDFVGLLNQNLTKEEQIYIQCAPAGASTQTKAVKVDATKSSKKDSDNLSLLISATVIIVVNILVIGIGYTSIYGLLSRFFVRNVIENGHHKRRDSPLDMFLMWILDNGPHFEFVNSAWNNQTRTSAEKLIRVFVFAFYTMILVMILYGYNTKGKRNLVHLAFYILFIYIADVFFFFIQIHNMSIQQYESLKQSSDK